MKNNRDKKIYWGLAGAVAVLIVFAALTITYIQKFNRTLIEENEAHLSEILYGFNTADIRLREEPPVLFVSVKMREESLFIIKSEGIT